ncbi:hypothetical protein [Protaetiibacter larvae]|uniref:PH domain-containing protein n=1 Tax=Protaetiibacter larvae TaxID=2592654 RepID=A0A5C1Y7P8_9MICO|nr:hypothetical protein [Protaetiibacter larvae]QEO09299.1 hypothetical protein FLP23_04305 [Protaetiibacter larvae]
MRREAVEETQQLPLLARDTGRSAPTPLFLGFLGALVLVGAFAFRRGLSLASTADFLMLAAIVTGAVLVAFSISMIWATRTALRASELERARPGALVVRAMRVRGMLSVAPALDAESPRVPLGITLLADDTGLELWGGAAEHPARLARIPWESVDDIRRTAHTRWGRAAAGITVHAMCHGAAVELPLAIVGAGLGGLFAPDEERIDDLVAGLHARRLRALARA